MKKYTLKFMHEVTGFIKTVTVKADNILDAILKGEKEIDAPDYCFLQWVD